MADIPDTDSADTDLLTRGKKAITAAALGASLFVTGQAQGAKLQTAPPFSDVQPRDQARRDAIRDALLEQARRQYPSLLGTVNTGYSNDLRGLQLRLNTDLRTEGNRFHSQAVIIDPTKFDVAMAIGLNSAASVNAQLQARGITAPISTVNNAGDKMSTGFATRFGPTYMQDPTAFTNLGGGPREACVIVPTSDHAMTSEMNIRGLPAADRVKFLDLHETWHCRDDHYSAQGINTDEIRKVNIADPASIASNADACKALALSYQKEAFADTGAIGSMLREGYDISLLDKVSNWRQDRPADMIHITTPVLQGLKQEITAMGGIDKFRALNDDQAKALYYKVVDKYGVTGPGIQTALKYGMGNGLQRLGHQIDAIFDSDSSKGIDFFRYFSRTGAPAHETPLTPQQTAAIDAYNPQAQLEARAFQLGKKITPVTMIQAYTQIQDELRAQMNVHPDDALYPQQMNKLQRDFTTNVKNMDYVAANQRVGVNIVAVEPALGALAGQPSRPGTPRTPQGPAVKP